MLQSRCHRMPAVSRAHRAARDPSSRPARDVPRLLTSGGVGFTADGQVSSRSTGCADCRGRCVCKLGVGMSTDGTAAYTLPGAQIAHFDNWKGSTTQPQRPEHGWTCWMPTRQIHAFLTPMQFYRSNNVALFSRLAQKSYISHTGPIASPRLARW